MGQTASSPKEHSYPTVNYEVMIWGYAEHISCFENSYNFLTSPIPTFGQFILSPMELPISPTISNDELLNQYTLEYLEKMVEFDKNNRLPTQGILSHYNFKPRVVSIPDPEGRNSRTNDLQRTKMVKKLDPPLVEKANQTANFASNLTDYLIMALPPSPISHHTTRYSYTFPPSSLDYHQILGSNESNRPGCEVTNPSHVPSHEFYSTFLPLSSNLARPYKCRNDSYQQSIVSIQPRVMPLPKDTLSQPFSPTFFPYSRQKSDTTDGYSDKQLKEHAPYHKRHENGLYYTDLYPQMFFTTPENNSNQPSCYDPFSPGSTSVASIVVVEMAEPNDYYGTIPVINAVNGFGNMCQVISNLSIPLETQISGTNMANHPHTSHQIHAGSYEESISNKTIAAMPKFSQNLLPLEAFLTTLLNTSETGTTVNYKSLPTRIYMVQNTTTATKLDGSLDMNEERNKMHNLLQHFGLTNFEILIISSRINNYHAPMRAYCVENWVEKRFSGKLVFKVGDEVVTDWQSIPEKSFLSTISKPLHENLSIFQTPKLTPTLPLLLDYEPMIPDEIIHEFVWNSVLEQHLNQELEKHNFWTRFIDFIQAHDPTSASYLELKQLRHDFLKGGNDGESGFYKHSKEYRNFIKSLPPKYRIPTPPSLRSSPHMAAVLSSEYWTLLSSTGYGNELIERLNDESLHAFLLAELQMAESDASMTATEDSFPLRNLELAPRRSDRQIVLHLLYILHFAFRHGLWDEDPFLERIHNINLAPLWAEDSSYESSPLMNLQGSLQNEKGKKAATKPSLIFPRSIRWSYPPVYQIPLLYRFRPVSHSVQIHPTLPQSFGIASPPNLDGHISANSVSNSSSATVIPVPNAPSSPSDSEEVTCLLSEISRPDLDCQDQVVNFNGFILMQPPLFDLEWDSSTGRLHLLLTPASLLDNKKLANGIENQRDSPFLSHLKQLQEIQPQPSHHHNTADPASTEELPPTTLRLSVADETKAREIAYLAAMEDRKASGRSRRISQKPPTEVQLYNKRQAKHYREYEDIFLEMKERLLGAIKMKKMESLWVDYHAQITQDQSLGPSASPTSSSMIIDPHNINQMWYQSESSSILHPGLSELITTPFLATFQYQNENQNQNDQNDQNSQRNKPLTTTPVPLHHINQVSITGKFTTYFNMNDYVDYLGHPTYFLHHFLQSRHCHFLAFQQSSPQRLQLKPPCGARKLGSSAFEPSDRFQNGTGLSKSTLNSSSSNNTNLSQEKSHPTTEIAPPSTSLNNYVLPYNCHTLCNFPISEGAQILFDHETSGQQLSSFKVPWNTHRNTYTRLINSKPLPPIDPLSYLHGCYLIPMLDLDAFPTPERLEMYYNAFSSCISSQSSPSLGPTASPSSSGEMGLDSEQQLDLFQQFQSDLRAFAPKFSHNFDPLHRGYRYTLPQLGQMHSTKSSLQLLFPQRVMFFLPSQSTLNHISDWTLQDLCDRHADDINPYHIDHGLELPTELAISTTTPSLSQKRTTITPRIQYPRGTKSPYYPNYNRTHQEWFLKQMGNVTETIFKDFLENVLHRDEFLTPSQIDNWSAVLCLEEEVPRQIAILQAQSVGLYAHLAQAKREPVNRS